MIEMCLHVCACMCVCECHILPIISGVMPGGSGPMGKPIIPACVCVCVRACSIQLHVYMHTRLYQPAQHTHTHTHTQTPTFPHYCCRSPPCIIICCCIRAKSGNWPPGNIICHPNRESENAYTHTTYVIQPTSFTCIHTQRVRTHESSRTSTTHRTTHVNSMLTHT